MEQETRRERQAAGIEAAKERGVYKGRKIGTTKAAPQRAMNLKAIGLSNVEIANVLGVSRMTVFAIFEVSWVTLEAISERNTPGGS